MLRPASRRLTRTPRILTRESRILGAEDVRHGRAWASGSGRQRPADERLLDLIQDLNRASTLVCTLDVFQSSTDDGGEDVDDLRSPCLRRPRAPPGLDPCPRREAARWADAQPRERPPRAFPCDAALFSAFFGAVSAPPTGGSSEAVILGRIT